MPKVILFDIINSIWYYFYVLWKTGERPALSPQL